MPYVNAGPYTIWYVEGGMGTPVVFIHDIGCTNWVWKNVYPTNPKGTFYYMLDLPGHGGSSPVNEITIREYAKSVIAFAQYHEFKSMFLVGHHLGGAVALEAAKTDRKLVKGIVLLNTPRRFSMPSSMVENLDHNPEIAIEQFISATLSENSFEELRRDLVMLMKHRGEKVFIHDIKACLDYDVVSKGSWRGPSLHILSKNQRMFDKSQAFSEFETYILDGGGHYPMLEASEGLVKAVNGFLMRHIKPPKEVVRKGGH